MSKIDQPQALADSYKGVYECPTVRQRRPSPKTATDNQGPARYCRPTSQVPAPAAPSRSARSATSRPAPLDAAAPWQRPAPWPWSRSSAARPATGAPLGVPPRETRGRVRPTASTVHTWPAPGIANPLPRPFYSVKTSKISGFMRFPAPTRPGGRVAVEAAARIGAIRFTGLTPQGMGEKRATGQRRGPPQR